MSNFDLEDEFIARTQKNLIAIECLKEKGVEVYEVTQLLNSMLGLLIFPKERRLYEKIQPKSWDTMVEEGWPLPSGDNAHVSDLEELIRHMRNAVAHCKFNLTTDHDEISSIEFRDIPSFWTGVYDVASLRKFVYMFLDHIQSSSRR
ncbi:MAG TPA: HEPN family nuclease [Alphaproteobacteria bacterium]|jgi:hypothetical protein|nr:HEPN family nuclease [Alphaproteobacteria bacterium]